MVYVYTGEGNGKTLVAINAAIKCAENSNKIIFTQFLKNDSDSELSLVQKNDKIAVLLPKTFSLDYELLSSKEKIIIEEDTRNHFRKIVELVEKIEIKMIVFDRILDAYQYNILNGDEIKLFLEKNREKIDIILTGECLKDDILKNFSDISEIRTIKGIKEKCYNNTKIYV